MTINFPEVLPQPRPIVSFNGIPDPYWFSGFVDGEGCFYVSTSKSKKIKTGVSVALVFCVSQHVRDKLLLTKFMEYLGCGTVQGFSTRPTGAVFTVNSLKYIAEKVIPFFQNYPLQGIKGLDYQCFCEVAKIMKDKGHLTDEGVRRIKSLKSGMNTGRIHD